MMNRKELIQQLEDCPVIAAVKDEEGLQACLDSEIGIVFVLFGDICTIPEIVRKLKEREKTVIVHIDLIAGLSGKEVAVNFIHSNTEADGIISTKPALIRQAKEHTRSRVSLPLIPWPSTTSADSPKQFVPM